MHRASEYLSKLTVYQDIIYYDYFHVQIREFVKARSVKGMRFPCKGAYVVWQWKLEECVQTSDEEAGHEDVPESGEVADIRAVDTLEADEAVDGIVHTLTFKCIGATRDMQQQAVLQQVKQLLHENKEVPVKLSLKPDNPYDAKAIAFQCFLDGKWQRIGYVVREVLEEVHEAMRRSTVTSVSFTWAKYLVKWSVSGAGYYAGINITKRGQWSQTACRSASTI